MDISQYSAQTLLGPRHAGLDPVPPVSRDDAQPPPHGSAIENGLFDTMVGTVADTVNPLQHIPGVNGVYREITGDTANPVASMAGGLLFGGPVGLAAGAAGSFLEMLTGKSLMGHAMALFSGDDASAVADSDGAEHVKTAAAGADPLLENTPGASVGQYQAFAGATGSIHQGFGAKATDVGWAENVWTQQALKQATGTYEDNQRLGGAKDERVQRMV